MVKQEETESEDSIKKKEETHGEYVKAHGGFCMPEITGVQFCTQRRGTAGELFPDDHRKGHDSLRAHLQRP